MKVVGLDRPFFFIAATFIHNCQKMAKPKPKAEKLSPLIEAMAEHCVDEALAAHDAKRPRRKRLSTEFYKDELAKEDPRVKKGSKDGQKHERETE